MRNSTENSGEFEQPAGRGAALLAATLLVATAPSCVTPAEGIADAINRAIADGTVDVKGVPPAIEEIGGELKDIESGILTYDEGSISCYGEDILSYTRSKLICALMIPGVRPNNPFIIPQRAIKVRSGARRK